MEKTVTTAAWPDLFERTKRSKDFLRTPKWGRTLQCAVRAPPAALVTLRNTQELVELCQARCIPFLVRHQRKLDDRFFTGLVTQAYSVNGRLTFKVLYPYRPGHHYEGTLYETLSGGACRMYADYNTAKMARERQAVPFVRKANSNGWCHLMCEVNCAAAGCDDHTPYEFVRHMEDVFPRALRERLSNNLPCEFHTGFLPASVHVPHDLELDHLIDPARLSRGTLTPKEVHAVDAAVGMLRTAAALYAQEAFTNDVCREQLCHALQGTAARTTVPAHARMMVQLLHDVVGRMLEGCGPPAKRRKKAVAVKKEPPCK